MKIYTIEELKLKFKELNFNWYDFHIIGIRSIADRPNEFDDKIYIINKNNIYEYIATTNPGSFYLMIKNWLNPKGAAILKSNKQYINCWTLGLHNGREALIQCDNVIIYRDNNNNLKSEELGIEIVAQASTRIDIHDAAKGVRTWWINNYSAGCQVLAENYPDFLQKCKDSKLKLFTYSLLREF